MILGNCDQNQCYTSLSPVTIFEKKYYTFQITIPAMFPNTFYKRPHYFLLLFSNFNVTFGQSERYTFLSNNSC